MSAEAATALPAADDSRAGWKEFRHNVGLVLRSWTFLIGAMIVLFWALCAIFGLSLVPYDPFADDMLNSLAPPSAEHWFGTLQL